MGKFATVVGAVVIGIVIVALFMTVPVWLLWNWLMPDIFNLTRITFWQALGIALLSTCLFRHVSVSKEN